MICLTFGWNFGLQIQTKSLIINETSGNLLSAALHDTLGSNQMALSAKESYMIEDQVNLTNRSRTNQMKNLKGS